MKIKVNSQSITALGSKSAIITLLTVALLSACGGSSSSDDTISVGNDNADSTTPTPTPTTNTAPISDAGNDQLVNVGMTVTLDGSASSDAEQDSLSYLWIMENKPVGSTADLEAQTSVDASFEADIAGAYTISLVVNDGNLDSQTDTVTVTAGTDNMDITNIEFSNRSGDCRDYTGSYFSNVEDIQRAIDFSGDVIITATESHCVIASNEIPNHDFNDVSAHFANNVSEQNNSVAIPINPAVASEPTQLSLRVTNVIFLNGANADLLAAACYGVGNEALGTEKIGCFEDQQDNPWRYDPMSPLNNFGTDSHNAHTQPDGSYHYHGNPMAMYDQDCAATGVASPVIGFAADGFPVYGPCFEDASGVVAKAQSSYQFKHNGSPRQDVPSYTTPAAGQGTVASANYDGQFRGDYEYVDNSGDLDECNGMTVDGQYGYYITDSYPWVLACYRGTPDTSFSKNAEQLSNSMHVHDDGTVHSHTH